MAALRVSKLKRCSAASASPSADRDDFGESSSFAYLPQHLIMSKILVRLRVEDLVRFQLVSKSWYSDISSPGFIKLHREMTPPKEAPRSFIVHSFNPVFRRQDKVKESLRFHGISQKYGERRHIRDLISLHSVDCYTRGVISIRDIGLPYDCCQSTDVIPNHLSTINVIGIINGIICVWIRYMDTEKNNFYLWNPATRRSKELPAYNMDNNSHSYLTTGFGFDCDADDYKVLWAAEVNKGIRVEVYSANDMNWKDINVDPRLESIVKNCNSYISVNGYLYWSVNEKLVAYSLNKEKFSYDIELPKVEVTGGTERIIVELENKVALGVQSVGVAHTTLLSFWTLENENGKGCWSMIYKFEALPICTPYIYGHLHNGNMLATTRNELILYDTTLQKLVSLWLPSELRTKKVFTYAESLVSIRGSEQVLQ